MIWLACLTRLKVNSFRIFKMGRLHREWEGKKRKESLRVERKKKVAMSKSRADRVHWLHHLPLIASARWSRARRAWRVDYKPSSGVIKIRQRRLRQRGKLVASRGNVTVFSRLRCARGPSPGVSCGGEGEMMWGSGVVVGGGGEVIFYAVNSDVLEPLYLWSYLMRGRGGGWEPSLTFYFIKSDIFRSSSFVCFGGCFYKQKFSIKDLWTYLTEFCSVS